MSRASSLLMTDFCQLYARARVMGSYPEIVAKPNMCVTENQRRRCASAIRARPAFVLGPVDSPPWNRQRRFPGTTLMMHGAPALVLAQHIGRNLRFNCATGRARTAADNQCRSRQAPSEHMRVRFSDSEQWSSPVKPPRSQNYVKPHDARTRLHVANSDRAD